MRLQRYFRRKRRLFLSGRGKGACRSPGMLLDVGMRNGYKRIMEGDRIDYKRIMEGSRIDFKWIMEGNRIEYTDTVTLILL